MTPYEKVTFRASIILWTIVFLVMCSSCSMLTDLATGAVTSAVTKEEPLVGIDTEVVAGDKQGIKTGPDTKLDDVQVSGNLTTSTTGRNTEFAGDAGVVNLNEGVPFWMAVVAVLLALAAGLLLPQYRINKR